MGGYDSRMPLWLKKPVTAALTFVVLAGFSFMLDAIFDLGLLLPISAVLIGSLLLVLLYAKELGLNALSVRLLSIGVRYPMSFALIVVVVGASLGAVLFASSWFYKIHEYMKNPAPIPQPHLAITTPPKVESSEVRDEVKGERIRGIL